MDGLSLEQVVQQIDRNMTDLSAMEDHGCKSEVKHSTPQLSSADDGVREDDVGGKDDLGKESGVLGGSQGGVLELVGHKVKPQPKSGTKSSSQKMPAFATKTKSKTKVRNYNKRNT